MKCNNKYELIHFFLHKKINFNRSCPLELRRIYEDSKLRLSDLAYRKYLTDLEKYQFDLALSNMQFIYNYFLK